MKKLKRNISKVVLIPSDGGRFEISLNGKLLYSKLKEGRFPEQEEVFKLLKK